MNKMQIIIIIIIVMFCKKKKAFKFIKGDNKVRILTKKMTLLIDKNNYQYITIVQISYNRSKINSVTKLTQKILNFRYFK
jgi:hypothetical protein